MNNRKSQSGFSMVEILVSILILSFGLLGLAALQAVAMKNSHSAYYRNQATIMAHEVLDRIRANPGAANANVASYNIALAAPAPAGAAIANIDLSEWKNHIAASLPVGQGGVTVTNTNQVAVVVQWDDSRGVNGSGVQQLTIESTI
ncbi:MAG: type IV pilus modification protein PilV [Sulfuriferula sp.]